MTKRTIDWAAKTALLLLASVFLTGACCGQTDANDFGTVKYLKQCPEYKRGYDPLANRSGTLQENVDVYSGKLNLTFPLPPVPWGATKSFGLVLIYNSNVWMRQETASVTVGGETATGKTLVGPSENPTRSREKMVMTFPEYWCNDDFVRFSPIGRPHAMPGWTLTVGGVYTEYCSGPEMGAPSCIANVSVWSQPISPRKTVKKKFFVAPDGSTHLLVDFQTNCLPYFSYYLAQDGASQDNVAELCSLGDPVEYYMPHIYVSEARVWRAMDGSGYYYVEKVGDNVPKGDVYGPDGTRYELDKDGMITSITDIDLNVVTITSTVLKETSGKPITKTISYASGQARVDVVFNYKEWPNWAPAKAESGHNWDYSPVSVWLLDRVVSPVAKDEGDTAAKTQTIQFNSVDLVEHLRGPYNLPGEYPTIRWSDLFANTSVIQGGAGVENIETGPFIFCTSTSPNAEGEEPAALTDETDMNTINNSNVVVMDWIQLPDNSKYFFEYNMAGKIKKIVYPDGGYREYGYGNTMPRSHSQSQEAFRAAARPWESALGGVSAVWRLDPATNTKVLEQALAYSYPPITPTASSLLTTVLLKGDKSVEVHDYMVQPGGESPILQYGFAGWAMGKPSKVRRYGFTTANLDGFADYFNPVAAPLPAYIDNVKAWLQLDSSVACKQEETYTYENKDDVWVWSQPLDFCGQNPASVTMDCFYENLVSAMYPECGNVMTKKVLKQMEGGITLQKTFTWKYEEVKLTKATDNRNRMAEWREPNVRKVEEAETDWNKTAPETTSHYSWKTFWPDPGSTTGLPVRLLSLPVSEYATRYNQSEVLARTSYEYPATQTTSDRKSFHPVTQKALIAGSREASTRFAYTGGTSSPVRLSTVDAYEGSNVASKSKYEYEGDAGMLLKKATVYNGESSEVQYMAVKYDPYTGLLLSRKDKNGDINGNSIVFMYDDYNRPLRVILKNGAAAFNLTEFSYSSAAPYWTLRKDYLENALWKETKAFSDIYGRPWWTWTTLGPETLSGGGEKVNWTVSGKTYDILGRVKREYGPQKMDYSAAVDVSPGPMPFTEHSYDALGRECQTSRCSANGAAVGTSRTEYGHFSDSASARTMVTVYDEMNRWRKTYLDGYGRIAQVDESPSGTTVNKTSYGYTPLGSLKLVTQTDQTRTFEYDCQGKLTKATLPELTNGYFSYQYNDQGDLLSRTLTSTANGEVFRENFSVDGLGRVTGRTTQKNGAVVESASFTYDTSTNNMGWGRLRSDTVSYPDGSSIGRTYAYEWHGLLKQKDETLTPLGLGGALSPSSFSTVYSYGSAGQLNGASYPSGAAVAFAYGQGGGLTQIASTANSAVSSFAKMTYFANGSPESAKCSVGSASFKTVRQYDETTLWLKSARVGNEVAAGCDPGLANVLFALDYTHEANGNVLTMNRTSRQTYGSSVTSLNQSYSYDNLNRLATYSFVGEGMSATNYSYGIDLHGNLLSETRLSGDSRAPASLSMQTVSATNRLYNKSYDDLGNLLAVSGANGSSLTLEYLDQGHVSRVTGGSDGEYRYYYDADGKRRVKVHKLGGSGTGLSFMFYEGEDLVCQKDVGDLVQEAAAYEPKVLLTDHLGTTRAEVKINSSNYPYIAQKYDTMPYGRLVATTSPTESVLFTGKPRDRESGLDDFGARPYSQFLGRWNSPDQPFADNHLTVPQSWNLYSYCANTPTMFVDPNGRELYLKGNVDYLLKMIKGWAGKLANYVSIDPGGKINFNPPESEVSGEAKRLYDMVRSLAKIVFYYGEDANAAAGLFTDGNTKDSSHKGLKLSFTGHFFGTGSKLVTGGGTIVGTSGRLRKPQPANDFFAAIAANSKLRMLQIKEMDPRQTRGNGKDVSISSYFMHEGTENVVFWQQVHNGASMDYFLAHGTAIEEEIINKDPHDDTGYAGALLHIIVP